MKIIDALAQYLINKYGWELDDADDTKQTLIEIKYEEVYSFLKENGHKQLFSKNFLNLWESVEKSIRKWTKKNVLLRLIDYPLTHQLQELDSHHVGDFIRSKAMIKNITPIQLRLTEAVLECDSCNKIHRIRTQDGKPPVIGKCTECGGTRFSLDKQSSSYENYRYLKLEEPLELRSDGDSREFMAEVKGYLASPHYPLKPGDVCDIAGLFDVTFDEKKGITPLFRLWHIKPLNNTYKDLKLTDDDIIQIFELKESGEAYKKFIDSVAPRVMGYETIKKGIVLQMFGGNQYDKMDFTDRSVMHILLIGDPGVGKSKLIESIHETAPKAIRANGAGTSQAGLTATAVKDELTGSWTMEAGGIVLADGGVLTIDEFDKLPKPVMKALNEPMEQLSVSVAKAGLVQTMTARTSVLAGANPKYGRFDKYKSIAEQLDIPSSTISRFDLIFVINDDINYENDIRVSKKILNKEYTPREDLLSIEFMKKYINYARMNYSPTLSDDAILTISNFYAKTRQLANQDDVGKPITLREMGAISRLSIAKAKLELREEVTVEDANEAIKIYSESLESLGLSLSEAGEIQNVYSQAEMRAINQAEKEIREWLGEGGFIDNEFKEDLLIDLMTGYKLSKEKATKFCKMAYDNVKEER